MFPKPLVSLRGKSLNLWKQHKSSKREHVNNCWGSNLWDTLNRVIDTIWCAITNLQLTKLSSTNTHTHLLCILLKMSSLWRLITGLLVSSGLRRGRKTQHRHAENDLHFEGRTSLLVNRSITATFELRRVYKVLPLATALCCVLLCSWGPPVAPLAFTTPLAWFLFASSTQHKLRLTEQYWRSCVSNSLIDF